MATRNQIKKKEKSDMDREKEELWGKEWVLVEGGNT